MRSVLNSKEDAAWLNKQGISILVKDGDIEELATQMQLLMSNAELRKAMGQKAIKNIGRYNPERIMDQWDNLLNSI